MLALPTAAPVMVVPETVALPLLEAKLPPLKPAGAEALTVLPWTTVPEDRITVLELEGHEPAETL